MFAAALIALLASAVVNAQPVSGWIGRLPKGLAAALGAATWAFVVLVCTGVIA